MSATRLAARRGTLLSLALVVAALVVVGCGAGDGGGTAATPATGGADAAREAIRARFDEMLAALQKVDGKAACPLMSGRAQQTFGAMAGDSGSCAKGFAKAFATGIDEASDPRVVRIDVAGDRAAVFARVPGSDVLQRAPFVKEAGEWKVHGWLTD